MIKMELRKDYILDRWSVIAEKRAKRKHEFKKEKKDEKKPSKDCFFCPGNESLTPNETGRIEKNGKWTIRWFPNKFPAVNKEGNPSIRNADKYFTYSDAYGIHEIIVETPDHNKQLSDLSEKKIKEVLEVYSKRIKELGRLPETKYVLVFKNKGAEGGASLMHSHTQLLTYNKIPELVKDKVEASKKYEKCPYCEIIEIEKKSHRRVFENNSFVSFTPYSPRFNYEVLIFPKKHIKNITEMDENMLSELASMLKKILSKLKEVTESYNFFLHYSPEGEDLHFHIEICPRRSDWLWAGFELGTNATIIAVSPEDAARFYRGEE
jgi:UDPglucose--hexose-1-phosphate uridylyltransferase